jgi:hypothetical protein
MGAMAGRIHVTRHSAAIRLRTTPVLPALYTKAINTLNGEVFLPSR